MSDLNVVATIPAKPGHEEEVGAALQKLAAASREETGCIAYQVYESAAAPGVFVTIEKWESQEHLDAHMKAPNLAAAMSTVGEHLGELAIHPLKEF